MQLSKSQTINVYLFPGQGGDENLFKYVEFDSIYKIHHISYPVPEKGEDLPSFAKRFIPEIDTTTPYALIGVFIGGMICTELTDILNPLKTIIISSAKNRYELPTRYTFQRFIPINRVVPKKLIKGGARIISPIVERDRLKEKETCKEMLLEKDPIYLKRTIDMIINWKRETYSQEIVHIHGTDDHTIPIRDVNADFIVNGGSHMMVLTQADAVNKIINAILDMQ